MQLARIIDERTGVSRRPTQRRCDLLPDGILDQDPARSATIPPIDGFDSEFLHSRLRIRGLDKKVCAYRFEAGNAALQPLKIVDRLGAF